MKTHTTYLTFNTTLRRELIRITEEVQATASNEVAAELSPDEGDYRHHRGGEDNGDAHLKNLLVHHQAIVPSAW